MQYPIYVSVSEASRLLSLGKTSIFARIKRWVAQGSEMGRSTRITFSSVIEYARSCLKDWDNACVLCDASRVCEYTPTQAIAAHFACRLCNTHREPTQAPAIVANTTQSAEVDTNDAGSLNKNLGESFVG
jgi:hypothetical protein